ncbi:hypothetical protein [Microbulbifer pacificus]|uniref:Uncharacterized protein n=1 Tax=Microbulbifer pacificus TaxID=407164 RepID=A0AAU0MYW3_9GAMM|nr:hypothetical protein [Microbulbifer pacificus]WOX05203.1 hypothetical protein R5R33_15875 [Microbulbifer pacificus]
MNCNHWESSYRREREQLRTPTPLEKKILADIRAVKPIHPAGRKTSRLLSRAASGFGAVAIAIVFLNPAQYIGAAPGQLTPPQNAETGLDQKSPQPALVQAKVDTWHALRTEVEAGNYVGLCAQWRRQQHSADTDILPKDLAAVARKHCRILP